MIPLPDVLAGPMVRRATAGSVVLWIATSRPLRSPQVQLYEQGPKEHLLAVATSSLRLKLGRCLYITLLKVADPLGSSWPTDVPIGYDIIEVPPSGPPQGLDTLVGLSKLNLRYHRRPTFILQSPKAMQLHALYGSCRKLHGPGNDLMGVALEILDHSLREQERPTVLFLGGDQIYADDVAGVLIEWIERLGIELVGRAEPLPYMPEFRGTPPGTRGRLLEKFVPGFTSGEMDNHVLTFGEYAALHVLAWNPDLWPEKVGTAYNREGAAAEIAAVREAKRGARAARKVLANIVSYLIFDDHEITDDWYLSESWKEEVLGSPAGRRIIANGLAAYFAFQGWGNAPDAYPRAFREALERYLGEGQGVEEFERALLGFDGWSYVAPTVPRALVLNTRTRRTSPARYVDQVFRIHPNHRLFDAEEKSRMVELLAAEKRDLGEPLIMVCPTPVFGVGDLEWLQQAFLMPDAFGDAESFAVNPSSIIDLADLARMFRPQPLVLLSGDVHFGFEITARLNFGGPDIRVVQLCSSAIKNSTPGLMGQALKMLNRRLSWSDRAFRSRQHPVGFWIIRDEVHILGMPRAEVHPPPLFRLVHRFEPRADSPSGPLITENNLGELLIEGHTVQHRFLLKSGRRDSLTKKTAFLRWEPDHWPVEERLLPG